MRIPRIYTPQDLALQQTVILDENAANHVARVLRMKAGRDVILFNGLNNGHYLGQISSCDRKKVVVKLASFQASNNESPLHIHLGQTLGKGDKMEWVIQKAVELGVQSITPLLSERCDVKLNQERLEKKQRQWQGIIISACEQCGRDQIPVLNPVIDLSRWLNECQEEIKWILDPRGQKDQGKNDSKVESVAIAVGPEGGFSEAEIQLANQHGFQGQLIGPRVLRTETAALSAISLLQAKWGDF